MSEMLYSNEFIYQCRRCGARTYRPAPQRQDVALLRMFEIMAGEDPHYRSPAQDRRWAYCSACPGEEGVGLCDLIGVQPVPEGAVR